MKTTKFNLDETIDAAVDVRALIEKLDFTEENIIEADREQAALFLEASRYRIKKLRQRIRAESRHENERAKASLYIRGKKKGVKGVTEGYFKDRVTLDDAVLAARERYDRAQVHEEWAKLLLEAFRQRSHAIKTLAELLGAEAFAQVKMVRKDLEVAGFEKLKDQVRKRFPGGRN